MVEKTSCIGAYSKLTQNAFSSSFFHFDPPPDPTQENYNLNSVSGMADTSRGPSNMGKGFSCFYLCFKFYSEYFLYILCGIAFNFNYRRGRAVFDTHCMCIGYIVYHFIIMLSFIRAFYKIVKKFCQGILSYRKKVFKEF